VAIPQELRAEGVEVRIGLLAGEVELGGDDLGRIAVSPFPPTRDVPPRPPVGSDARNGSANHAFGPLLVPCHPRQAALEAVGASAADPCPNLVKLGGLLEAKQPKAA
jgi:hypothetical protein